MNAILVTALAAAAMLAVEQLRPGRRWPRVAGFHLRALALTAIQAAVVALAGLTWDDWLRRHQLFSAQGLGTLGGATVGYLAITFVYYWWHRARHEVPLLWRWLHQLHHSPARLEVLTSFYKHPLEVLANGVLSSAILYLLVGATPAAAALAVLATGLAELFYHWNVRTPFALGFLLQRPESHCVHHQRGRHASNYADLPLWDALFGTLHNPRRFEAECGFAEDREQRLGAMLCGVDVNAAKPARANGGSPLCTQLTAGLGHRSRVALVVLLLLGVGRMGLDLLGAGGPAAALGATGAAPAPRVFSSVAGLETYSSRFFLRWSDASGVMHEVELTPERAAALGGPYNRRNVYGAAIAYGPVLQHDARTAPLLEGVARHAFCGEAPLLAELGIPTPGRVGPVGVRLAPERTPPDAPWTTLVEVSCS